MSTFVLVHGAWHGEWCWEEVVPLLQDLGHRVVTLDLPGHGKDKTAPSTVTLKHYTDSVCELLDQESEPVILVGHSMGGLVITQTAEYRPEKIKLLVYVCAFLPTNEQTLLQILEHDKKDIPPATLLSEDKMTLKLKDSLIKDTFYGQCSETVILKAKEKLCLQPSLPFITPLHISEQNFGRIPRVYIETVRDQAISIKCQREMYTKTPCQQVITMDTDHSPFFSQPDVLQTHFNNLSL